MRNHPALDHKYELPQFTRGLGIEVGEGIEDSGTAPTLYPHFKHASDVESDASLDFVVSCESGASAERVSQWRADALRMLKDGGHLCAVKPQGLLVMRKVGEGFELVDRTLQAKPGRDKLACVVRYGGFGDMIQASSVFAGLQEQGFTVYVMTTPQGRNIIEHDPHVDGWLLQDTDQVPNEELFGYWEVQAKRFDRFVNLSESIEGTLLGYPGRPNHQWPIQVRQREMNRNYLEWTCQLAEVVYGDTAQARFWATDAEHEWAAKWLEDFRNSTLGRPLRPMEHVGPRFNILYTLAGSSIHKMWPHQDVVIRAVLEQFPEATFTLCGDDFCRMLEAGWEDHPRVRCTSGELSIRQTLTLAQQMDCVVGPETGVLNAVGFEPMRKVCLLSHSSHENLTRDWVNTVSVEPADTACYPCHQLHTDRRYCPEHKPTGASMCAWNTPPEEVFKAIAEAILDWRSTPKMVINRAFEAMHAAEVPA
jgi:ADP-heptose:LPS heptosyltransferase